MPTDTEIDPNAQPTPDAPAPDPAPDAPDADEPSMLDAVSAGLDEFIADETKPPEPAPDAGAPPADDGEPTPDAPPTAEPAPATDAPPAADAAPAAKRPSDEFGELPKDAKAETRERFDAMRTKYDSVVGERDGYKAEATKWIETVQSTGADPEQFGRALGWLSDLNSGTVEGLERAHATMSEALKFISQQLGKEAPGVDPLDAHPDLKKRVEDDLNLERADALEIAQARQRATLQQSQQQRQTSQQEQEQFAQSQIQSVQAFGARMKAEDPLYGEKMKVMEPIIRRVIGKLPPAEWPSEIEALYREVQVAAPAAAPPPRPAVVTPLRPSSTPGAGSTKQPASALDAINQGMNW